MRYSDEYTGKVQISCFLYVQEVLVKFMLHTAIEGFEIIIGIQHNNP